MTNQININDVLENGEYYRRSRMRYNGSTYSSVVCDRCGKIIGTEEPCIGNESGDLCLNCVSIMANSSIKPMTRTTRISSTMSASTSFMEIDMLKPRTKMEIGTLKPMTNMEIGMLKPGKPKDNPLRNLPGYKK
uniref:Uncharacterized protein n=1 Tax=viral metagenome TaxID=1070528 RepID=A0A6C0CKK7_9ZZZZ